MNLRGLVRLRDRMREKWFPELARFESEEERKDAYRTASGKCTWTGLPKLLVLVIGYYVATTTLLSFVPQWTTWIVIVVSSMAMGALLTWFFRNETRRRLRMRLINLGVPICLHCGYDLRGQTVARCPECGRSFAKRLVDDQVKSEP